MFFTAEIRWIQSGNTSQLAVAFTPSEHIDNTMAVQKFREQR